MNHETNPLYSGMANITQTDNGHFAYKTTYNNCLDFFYKAPTMDPSEVIQAFKKAYEECSETAIKLAFWIRDPRGGAGRRLNGRIVMSWLSQELNATTETCKNASQFGRFDDLLQITDMNETVIRWWIEQAKENPLAAKWLPRESSKTNSHFAKKIAKTMGWSMKQYRKFCTTHTKVVETTMCNRKWNEINYSHVPSQAYKKYSAAFQRNDEQRFDEFLTKVQEGQATVNTGAIYPHEILAKTIPANLWSHTTEKVFKEEEAQWKSQPKVDLSNGSAIVVADTSASMLRGVSVPPINVAMSLALWFSERLPAPWQNAFITFSEKAKFVRIDPEKSIAYNLKHNVESIVENTNLYSVFNLILNTAQNLHLKQSDLPTHIICVSDMEFDEGVKDTDSLSIIKEMYSQKGYKAPQVVYWNVNDSSNIPVTINQDGCALLSGYNPKMMKDILNLEEMSPLKTMRRVISNYPSNW